MRKSLLILTVIGSLLLATTAAYARPSAPAAGPLAALAKAAQTSSAVSSAPALPPFQIVAAGLDNPRGLAFGLEGALYVAEAGRGGSEPCRTGPEEGVECYGATGAITRIWNGQQTRVAVGLPSLAGEGGVAATGPSDISFRPRGGADVVIGFGGAPADRGQLGAVGVRFGRLVDLRTDGTWGFTADVTSYEGAANPDGGEVDSNPYAVFATPVGRVIADAGGNDLVSVMASGGMLTLAVFPDRLVDAPPFLGLPPGAQIPMQAVPTSIVRGSDGAYYVGQLTGFPFVVGGARVYRVKPGSAPEVFAEDFTNIIDLAFGPDGSLYVLEIAANGLLSGDLTGALIRVAPDGARTTIASAGLVAPGGLAVGPDGALYVSNFSIFPGLGQVIRIQP